jgi:uncharacterized protein YdiU (UPF0061 family)
MNAPHPEFLPMLPPLSPHAEPGSAPRIPLARLGPIPALDSGYAGLASDPDEPFSRPCDPSPLPEPRWLAVSEAGAQLIGMSRQDIVNSSDWLAWMSGNVACDGLQPHASVYAGHQFGVFVPRLGDGRALNLGAIGGWELQLKGAGPTPYGRFADGRAVLRSSIREFLCSEAMHALGIPTTRVLSLVTSPQPVLRESLETAAVVCRMAPSFVRFGTFQYFSSRGRHDALDRLVRSVWPQFFSPLAATDGFDSQRYAQALAESQQCPIDELALMMLGESATRTADLMARWMAVGFMHGVMNTDNFSILGLTLDYGPFGFMDGFDAGHICNHTDRSGRYSYQSQPQVGLWNVAQLCQSLHPLIQNVDRLQAVAESYRSRYATTINGLLRAKFGLKSIDEQAWSSISDDFYPLLQAQHIDYTLAFRSLASEHDEDFLRLAPDRDAAALWLARYRQACREDGLRSGLTGDQRRRQMNAVNPKVVLRNWVAEEAIRAVRDHGQPEVLQKLAQRLGSPFEEHPDDGDVAKPPPAWANDLCVSCSS